MGDVVFFALILIVVVAPGLVFLLIHLATAVLSDPIISKMIVIGLVSAVLVSVWRDRRRRRP